MNILELKEVTFVYEGTQKTKTYAVNKVDLSFEKGLINGIIGPTGSGKSTLVQMLNGILKPTSGQILLEGKNIWDEPKKMRNIRFKIGLVMQYPEYQLFDETVESDIAYGPKNMGLSKTEINERVFEAARFAALDLSLMKKSPFDLSGGQKRRAALAGVLAMRPEVLVLDEPAAGLDPGGRARILDNIKEYCRRSGTTVIIVSHSMEDMANYCDRISVMCEGRISMTGTVPQIFSRYTDLLAIGLDVPQVTRVAAGLFEQGVDIGRDVYTVKYAADRIMEYIDNRRPAADEF